MLTNVQTENQAPKSKRGNMRERERKKDVTQDTVLRVSLKNSKKKLKLKKHRGACSGFKEQKKKSTASNMT